MDKVTEMKVEMLDERTGSLILAIPDGATHFEAWKRPYGYEIKFVKVERDQFIDELVSQGRA